jgi:type I restriction enzyme S subunit
MEVRKGYKQTEVGIIPEDWDVSTFQSLANIERGKFTARPRNDPKYYGGDIPFIQTGDVTNSNGQISTYSQTLNQEGLKVSKLFPKGTLFFTIAANIGDVGFTTFDTACPDSLVAITPNKKVDKRWLAHELKKRKTLFENLATHNAQLNINLEKLRPYLLPVPPFAEQEAIAEALSDADAFIETVDQLLTKKRQVKQGAMQDLITGKRRLSGFSGEWNNKTLGEIGECFAGGTPSTFRSDYWDGDIYWLPSGRVQNCILHSPLEDETKITKRGLDESSAKLIKAQSVLVAITGATCANVACLEFTSTANQSVVAIEPFDTINYRFLYYSMLMMRNVILSLQGGSAQGGINLKTVKSITLRFPSIEEQTAIAEILSDMDAEISSLEEKLVKARQVKAGMMSELLTGKIRLG